MLTGKGIKDAVTSGKIEITYSCLPDTNGIYKPLSSAVNPLTNNDAATHFETCIGENRIKLSVGFLVKSIYKSHIGTASQYHNFNIHDLRKSDYNLDPLETIIVYTNEWIHLKNGYAGIIIQRVSHYFRGLSIAPSYVATGWEGILLAQITNNSAIPQNISLGDDIARLFIFETKGVDDVLPNTSIHYRKKWHDYINLKRNPFEEFGDTPPTCGDRNDVISSLMVSALQNSSILKSELKSAVILHQSQAILNALQNDEDLKVELKKLFIEEKTDAISKIKSYLQKNKLLGNSLKISVVSIVILFSLFQLALATSFYINLIPNITNPKEAINPLLDFASFGGRLKVAEDKLESVPVYGTYSFQINDLVSTKGVDREKDIEKGNRESLWIIGKSPECGEIESFSSRKSKEKFILNFASNKNKKLNTICTIKWVLVDDKS